MTARLESVSPAAYPAGLRRLHWLMALLLPAMIGLGLWMGTLPRGHALKTLLLNWHVAVGLAVLLLALLRLWLRRRTRLPELPAGYPAWRSYLVRCVYGGFYLLMTGLPLLGLAVWALDPFVGPALFEEAVWISNTAGWLHRLHYLGAWLLLFLLIPHMAGALSSDGQGSKLLKRMLPGKR